MSIAAKATGRADMNLFDAVKQSVRAILPQSVLNWREARFYGKYGEVELHLLDLLCRRDADAIDVGANDGCYVHYLLPNSRHVHAFEPMPSLVQGLQTKFADQVTIHPIALSDQPGTAELHMPVVDGVLVTGCATVSERASATYPAHRAVSVPMMRLDDAYQGNVGFIKIDVEGHEQAVLDGGLRTISACRPRMLVEIDERMAPGGLAQALAYFDRLNYCGHFIYQGRLEPIANFSASQMQDPANLPDLTAPLQQRRRFGRYIYNFMFLPGEEADRLLPALRQRIAKL
jgi:FkbM family methyltransferase